jgi:uncharacterized protein
MEVTWEDFVPPSRRGMTASAPELERLDPRVQSLWRVQGTLLTAGLLALAAGMGLGLRAWLGAPPVAAFAPAAAALALGALLIGPLPALRWRSWRYGLREAELELRRGALFQTHTLIPVARIQQVDTRQGPLERAFGLATVVVLTAAGSAEIPALTPAGATALRDRIAALAGVRDDL